MKESEQVAFAAIRKAAGNTVSDDVWEEIAKQAEERGGLSALTGTARAVVDGVVVKHGQPGRDKNYGRMHPSGGKGGGGGGRGGSGGAMTNAQQSSAQRKLIDDGEVTQAQVLRAGGKSVKLKSGDLKGTEGTHLADMGDMGQWVGFKDKVTINGKNSNVHLLEDGDFGSD